MDQWLQLLHEFGVMTDWLISEYFRIWLLMYSGVQFIKGKMKIMKAMVIIFLLHRNG